MTDTKDTPDGATAEGSAPPAPTPPASADARSADTSQADTPRAASSAGPSRPPEPSAAEVVVTVPDDLSSTSAGTGVEVPRRVRARRAVAKTVEPERDRASQPRGPRKPRRRRGDRERKPADAKSANPASSAVGGGSPLRRARVYRQDPVDGIEPGPPPPPPLGDDEAKAKKIADHTQTTLILHPAPKAGGHARKKKAKGPKTAKEALAARAKGKRKQNGKSEKVGAKPATTLDPAWVGAGADDAVAALVTAGAGGAEGLVKAWVEADNLVAIAVGAASEALSGAPRKAVRRAARTLRARGVTLPEVKAKAPAEATAAEAEAEPVATFVPPDASGTMFISISHRQPGGGYVVADCVAKHGVGVVRASQGRLAGRKIRAWKDRVAKEYGAAPVEVPLAWARARIEEAKATNEKSGALMPLGFDSCAFLFEPFPEAPPPHPVADLTADEPEAAQLERAAADSERLHNEPEFRAWMPDRKSIDELLTKVGASVGSEEAASEPEQVNAALKKEVADATDRFFTPELRQAVSSWMRDAAISVRARSGDDAARHVIQVATAVERAGLITSPPHEIPFLLAFFQKAIAYVLSQNQGQLRVPIPAAPA
ncbi:MAG: hypothetical protein AAF715_02930 [Myxococcota bacterium]